MFVTLTKKLDHYFFPGSRFVIIINQQYITVFFRCNNLYFVCNYLHIDLQV